MAYAIGTNKTTVNITLMSPAIPMTQVFTAISKGYDTGAVTITITVEDKSSWRIVKKFAQDVWFTLTCHLKFQMLKYRNWFNSFCYVLKIATLCIALPRRVYAFRL